MKFKIIILLVAAFIAAPNLISCDPAPKKVEDARENVESAKNELNTAIRDSSDNFQKFQRESEVKISGYEKDIADLKVKIAHAKQSGRIKYQKMVNDLDVKIADLKHNLKEYKEDGKDKWEVFKVNFNRDMEKVGKSISNFFTTDINNK